MRAIAKDTAREMRRTLGRFFSIFIICAIGAAFFAGVRATSPDMRLAADTYFDEQNMMDLRVLSTVGFEQEDIDRIAAIEGLDGVQAGYTADVLATVHDKNMVAKLYSLPESGQTGTDNDINRPLLIKGRMPESEGECLADDRLTRSGVALGDTIQLASGTDDAITDTLRTDTLTVVGIVNSPLYTGNSRDSATIGNGTVSGFLLVPPGAFTLERYTQVTLTVAGAKGLMSYDGVYEDKVEPVSQALERLGEQRAADWETDVIQKAKDELADAEKEYRDGKKKADRAFQEGQKTIDDSREKLEENQNKWQQSVTTFLQSVDPSFTALSQVDGWVQDMQAKYDAALAEYQQNQPYLTPEQDAAAQTQLGQLKEGIETVKQGKARLADAKAQLDSGEKELEQAQKTLNAKKKQTKKDLDDAWEKILEARQDVADLPTLEWYVLDRNTNVGFVEYGFAADRMQAIGNVFPAFFFLVAALVCLTTMTRMVDEQRGNMGVCKALGYGKPVIASKYLVYALSASLLGSIVGVVVGMQLFPQVIFDAYNTIYNIPQLYKPMHADLAAMSIAMAVGTTIIATLWASLSSLSHKPSDLMRPKAPKMGKRILLERVRFFWKRLSFSGKVTARNLFRYKKRLCMTALGVAGCTALLLIGFGIRDSISTVATLQFDEVYQYQDIVTLKDDLPTAEIDTALAGVRGQAGVTDATVMYAKSQQTRKQGTQTPESDAYITVPPKGVALENWIVLREVKGKTPLSIGTDGVIITDKMAETLDAAPGDVIEIKTDKGWRSVTVQAVTEHYLNHYVYMSPETYQAVYGEPVAYNQVYVKTDSTEESYETALRENILKLDNITQVTSNTSTVEAFQDTVDNMMTVVVVLIISAGLLAFVVLYNLTNINIGERVREIATLKVLGFTGREVNLYVFRENLWLSLLGIAFGCLMGKALHLYIMTSVEIEMLRFGRQILPMSYLLSAVITLLFTLLVSVVMSRKLKKIDMVESLKSVE